MRILILISSLNFGGAEKQAVIDANMLSYEHIVFLGCYRKGPLEELLNKNVNLLQIKKGNYLLTAARLAKIIKGNKIEIIHASLFAAMTTSALASLFVARMSLFWHFHSHEYDLPVIQRMLYKYLGRLNSVKQILFVNSELKSLLTQRFKFPTHKTRVLYNTSSPDSSEKVNSKKKHVTIGYIGRLVELKRVGLLIDLAEYLIKNGCTDFSIVIVGDGNERDMLEDQRRIKNLQNFIRFEGFKTDTEMFYYKMDIFALPSREECLSMALIDAGTIGIPAVAFNVGGNNEVIDNGNTGFIVKTKEEFFEKIYYLVANEKIRTQLGKYASKYCYRKFGKKNHLAQLNSLYKEFVY